MTEETFHEIYAEQTPNPSALKFVSSRQLLVTGAAAEYASPEEASDAPLAQALFRFPFVARVFFSSTYISVTKHDAVEWEEIRDELRRFIAAWLNSGKPVINRLPSREVPKDSLFREKVTVNTQHAAPSNEVEGRIIEVLEQYVRPAVEQDGGMITFKDLKDGVVTVQMRGSCSGCPSSTMTLKAGIEALLKRLLPDEVKEVVSEAM